VTPPRGYGAAELVRRWSDEAAPGRGYQQDTPADASSRMNRASDRSVRVCLACVALPQLQHRVRGEAQSNDSGPGSSCRKAHRLGAASAGSCGRRRRDGGRGGRLAAASSGASVRLQPMLQRLQRIPPIGEVAGASVYGATAPVDRGCGARGQKNRPPARSRTARAMSWIRSSTMCQSGLADVEQVTRVTVKAAGPRRTRWRRGRCRRRHGDREQNQSRVPWWPMSWSSPVPMSEPTSVPPRAPERRSARC